MIKFTSKTGWDFYMVWDDQAGVWELYGDPRGESWEGAFGTQAEAQTYAEKLAAGDED